MSPDFAEFFLHQTIHLSITIFCVKLRQELNVNNSIDLKEFQLIFKTIQKRIFKTEHQNNTIEISFIKSITVYERLFLGILKLLASYFIIHLNNSRTNMLFLINPNPNCPLCYSRPTKIYHHIFEVENFKWIIFFQDM